GDQSGPQAHGEADLSDHGRQQVQYSEGRALVAAGRSQSHLCAASRPVVAIANRSDGAAVEGAYENKSEFGLSGLDANAGLGGGSGCSAAKRADLTTIPIEHCPS